MSPTKIAKTTCGLTIKVYDHISDWQVIAEGATHKELWFTNYKHQDSYDALHKSLNYNKLELLEIIK